MGRNVSAAKRGFLYDPPSRSLGIYVDGVKVQDYCAKMGRTYYVNQITGSDTADGLSWGSAMDQISTAIAASDTYRELGGLAPTVSTNDYIRNTIIVQAAGTYPLACYTPLTTLPLYTDIIGLGDWPAGLGHGFVSIGTVDTEIDGIEVDGDLVEGCNLFNLQVFTDKNGYTAMHVGNYFHSRIEDCWFGAGVTAAGQNPNAGIECDDSMSSILIRHCLIGQTNGNGKPVYGMDLAGCNPGSNNLFEDNVIFGTTTGILQTATDNWNGAVIRNNTIGSITGECSGTGITAALYELIIDNRIRAATGITVPDDGQCIGNICNQTGKTITVDLLDT